MTQKPYAPSADNNKAPILNIFKNYLKTKDTVLEIGSGTGQHICYFAENFPNITFHPSDLEHNLSGIKAWIEDSALDNILSPRLLKVSDSATYPTECHDVIYSANTAHIMSREEVKDMFSLVGKTLKQNGHFILYGPFNENGQFTSDSNRLFDQHLKSQAPHMGIRDKADLNSMASHNTLSFQTSHAMPANNQILVFQKL